MPVSCTDPQRRRQTTGRPGDSGAWIAGSDDVFRSCLPDQTSSPHDFVLPNPLPSQLPNGAYSICLTQDFTDEGCGPLLINGGTSTPITDAPQQDDSAESTVLSVPPATVETTVPCSGQSVSDSFDYVEGHQGAATIEEAVDGWTFEGGAPYLRAELASVVDAQTGRAALVDADGNLRILLTVRENENGWLVESSERCLDP